MREEKKCDLVIALTHNRTPNDLMLAEQVGDIDFILGGHDHIYSVERVNGTYMINSGCDFKEFNVLDLVPLENLASTEVDMLIKNDEVYKNRYKFIAERVTVDSSWEPDAEMNEHIMYYDKILEKTFS